MAIVFKVLVILVGVFFGAVWLQSLTDPAALAERLAIEVQGPVGLDTLRATVGGFYLAGALCCFLAVIHKWKAWLAAAMLIVLAAILGRLAGMFLDGYTMQTVQALVIGIAMLLILAAAYQFGERRDGTEPVAAE